MEDRFQVGIITSTHGVHGEVKVYPTTSEPNRFKKLKEVQLDTGKEILNMEIESVRFFKQMVILKFKGYDSINDIEKYKQKSLYVPRENAVRLRKDEFFIADVIGATVLLEDGTEFGTIIDVLETMANEVFVVQYEDTKEVLVPVIKDCVLSIDVEKNEVVIHLMEGLLD